MKINSIKKNIIMNIILTVSNTIFPLLTYSYVARILHAEGTGKVAMAASMLTYFSWIASLGIPTYAVRVCAKIRHDKMELSKCVQELFVINIISTVIAYFIFIVALIFIPEMNNESSLYIVMSMTILLNAFGIEWLYQALEQYSYITIRSIIFKFISVILIFVLIQDENDYVTYGGLTVFTTSASYILNFFNARKYISFKWIKNKDYRKHFKPIVTLLAATVIVTIYANFDVVMIGFIKDDTSVGIYNATIKIKNIVLATSTAITTVFIPRMARYYQSGNKQEFKNLAVKSLTISSLVAIPLCTYVLLNAPDIIRLVCGNEYLPATGTLRILMVSTYALILTNLIGNQMLIPMGLEKKYMQSVFWGMFINLGLNFVLIPKFGYEGAAFGTLVTECFNVFWMSKAIKEEVKFIISNYEKVKILLANLVALLICIISIISTSNMQLLIRLIITALLYFTTYYGFLFILKERLLITETEKVFMKISKFYHKKILFKLK